MNKLIAMIGVVVTGLLLGLGSASAARAPDTAIRTLVLYDDPGPGVDGNRLGRAYAIMLRNLLGHRAGTVDMLPVASYTSGKLAGYDATFYLGSYYDHPLPAAFLIDVDASTKPVVWFKYNLWQYAGNAAFNFNPRRGFSFDGLRGLNAAPTAANPNPGFFDTVTYKGRTLTKYYGFNAATGSIAADPDVGTTTILDPTTAQALVSVANPVTGEQVPYVVRSGNLWYFADMPLSFIGPRDRYLVLCDLLHDILDFDTSGDTRRALVRLEDVGALVNPATTRQLTDYMLASNIPFGIALIPRYRDPLGVFNGGVPMEIPFAQATALRTAVNYMVARGGRIVAHGWTHQYSSMRNPWSGVSGDDFEFWDIVNNRRLPEDSVAWARNRVDQAIAELGTRYRAFAFEVPHYHASPYAYQAVRQRFATSWGRLVYYTSDTPDLTVANPNRDFAVGQFFPYVIRHDHYGNKVLPENIGNIEYDLGAQDPSSNYNYTADDLLLNAANAAVVRGGFASFFFHPFWLEPSLGKPGFADFKKVVEGLTALGYTWADPRLL
jgi:uncharacterized protein YdaL